VQIACDRLIQGASIFRFVLQSFLQVGSRRATKGTEDPGIGAKTKPKIKKGKKGKKAKSS